ncbi:MAG: alkaline phosphatase [Cytophagales bacterium]|nr:alkaline phosphatase [Bernardetiaceae bacterium]MDW8209744.1 alkaline phosphatase [Cytophagales bacterium]
MRNNYLFIGWWILLGFLLIGNLSFAQKRHLSRFPRAKNIILMIGDGMGTAHVFAAYTAQKGQLHMMTFPVTGFSLTQSASHYITDSGAGGTALATGQRTYNGAISVDVNKQPLTTILEIAKKNGLATGIVVSCAVTHATPATFYAHQSSRAQDEDIAADLLKTQPDVVIGGGYKFFSQRKDQRNLVEELKQKGYQVVDSTADLSSFQKGKLIALVAQGHPAEVSGGRGNFLSKGVQTALNVLSQNKKGFFLMVEGSQIDWAGHENDLQYLVQETIDFDKAVGVALDFARKDGKTLVIVTADHETGGLAITNGDIAQGNIEAKFNTKDHTAVMVPVFAYGPGAEAFTGVQLNTDIFHKMLRAYRFNLP